jgi:hypothetical protein
MQSEKFRRKQHSSSLAEWKTELGHLRELVSPESHPEELEFLARLEQEVRAEERSEALAWQRRSRIRWLSLGEAPSRYFFAQLKAKQARDLITQLVDPGQEPITADTELIQKVESTFQEVFTVDQAVQGNSVERQAVLAKLPTHITALENSVLCALPTA